MKKATRSYNSWEHDWTLGTITKKSKTERLRNEIRYYREIPWEFRSLFPRMIEASGWDAEEHWMTLEYYDYTDLGLYMMGRVDNFLAPQDWISIMTQLRTILDLWRNHGRAPGNPAHAQAMYIEKTEREQKAFVEQNVAPRLFDGEALLINNQLVSTFDALWPRVREYIEDVIVPTYEVGMIHGDFCFSNILFGGSILRFIDPRGSFGEIGIFGDPRYDIAKIYHSVDAGYEFFNNDLFRVIRSENSFQSWRWGYGKNATANSVPDKTSALQAFESEFFEGTESFSRKDITLIEGLIYVGACARHYENPDRQVAMYLVGLQLLNKAMKL